MSSGSIVFHAGIQTERQTNMKLYVFAFRDVLFENNNKEIYDEYFSMDHRRAVTGKITTFTCISYFIVETRNMQSN
jgi:hypothetical protein